MFAQCPECLTFFRLKPSHLKAAGGRVRCSQCKHVFNALETLRDDLTPEEIAAVRDARKREPKPDAPLLNEDQVGDLFDGLEYTENGELPLESAGNSEPEPGELSAEDRDAAEAAELAAAPGPVFERETQPDQLAAPARETGLFGNDTPRRRHPVLLAIANVVLLLVLAAQVVHWQRFTLLEQDRAGPWLAKAYELLDMNPEPPRDPGALKVSRTEVSSHPDHPRALHLTAVLENTSSRVQPWPQLRVDLQDRWGETVGARYFVPAEYLRDSRELSSRLPANARLAIELAILDPGSDAVGFQVDACYESDRGHICSGDIAK